MANNDIRLLNDAFKDYYQKAKSAHLAGKFENAKRHYLLAAETMLKMAKTDSKELAKSRLQTAKKLLQIAESLTASQASTENLIHADSAPSVKGSASSAQGSAPSVKGSASSAQGSAPSVEDSSANSKGITPSKNENQLLEEIVQSCQDSFLSQNLDFCENLAGEEILACQKDLVGEENMACQKTSQPDSLQSQRVEVFTNGGEYVLFPDTKPKIEFALSKQFDSVFVVVDTMHYACTKNLNNFITDELDISEAGEYQICIFSQSTQIASFVATFTKGMTENDFGL